MSQSSVVPDGLKYWWQRTDPKRIKDHMDLTAWRGTQIHNWIEQYLEGIEDIAIEEWAIEPMTYFQDWAERVSLKAIHTELTMTSSHLGLGGTCDFIGTKNGESPCIMDWKTGQTSDKHFCQLAIYMYMVWETTGQLYKDLYIIGVHRDGKPIEVKKCPDPLKYLRGALLAYERWKFDNEDKLRWGSAPTELWDERKRSRGKKRKAIDKLWEPKFAWKWLEDDCLTRYEEFAKIYQETK